MLSKLYVCVLKVQNFNSTKLCQGPQDLPGVYQERFQCGNVIYIFSHLKIV